MDDVIIIGGGIVGLATAYKLLEQKPELKLRILEKEKSIGLHQSGHNSGVIHSGIYYKPGSVKAKNCRRGVEELLLFCDKFNVQYDLCGKVIVAVNLEEVNRLDALYKRGLENGISDVRIVDSQELKDLEPHATGIKAIHVPSTGIINYTSVVDELGKQIIKRGGEIKTKATVKGFVRKAGECIVNTQMCDYPTELVINCAGLYSDKIAQLAGENSSISIIPFRGEYYVLKPESRHLVNSLIYPVPDPRFPFLGVHFTRRIDGSVEAGPNAVLATAREGYRRRDFSFQETWELLTNPGVWKIGRNYWKTGMGEYTRSLFKPLFVKALQHLVPAIQGSDLVPGGSGVRAQAMDETGKLLDDFCIVQSERFIHVLNAPSPAATASFAIGSTIADQAFQNVLGE
ncbi:MAG TPA: L-2-hydroxyglutarate oxidase [Candidatus Marinimicrobia bacterium]|nr:L-2-hydroxyglutarate oxidase [Candidatus Neomarinimicrobiota bacterium]